ncbi:MAG: WecB/TagA/CpsF family glycosyltransferase [Candidatus Bipolaricaulota bacterium]|nr:WecB/TagA/CpsF family glycosyltransferase [Candidatus Bipolaricaulota bacterium]
MGFVVLVVLAGGALLLGGRGKLRFLASPILPLALLCVGGGRSEVLGLAAGLWILVMNGRKRGAWSWAQGGAAALVAAACGFRIQFVTHPSGGYLYLDWLSLPLTALWVVLLLRSREELRRIVPQPLVQHGIDLILVSNAIFLALVSPVTRGDPLAFHLPFALLGLVLVSIVAGRRGEEGASVHRAVVFGLALFAIGGAMKGPLSLALLLPLVLTGIPVMTTSQALVAQAAAAGDTRALPDWLKRRRFTQGSFAVAVLALASAVALGIVLAIFVSPAHALLVLGVVPLVMGAKALQPRLEAWLERSRADAGAGRSVLFGVGFHDLSLREAVACVEGMLGAAAGSRTVVTPNSASLLRSLKDRDLLAAYEQAGLVTADGVGVVWASRLLGVPLSERVCGIDLAESLLERAAIKGYRVFLLGGRPGVAERAAGRLEGRYPGLSIVATHHGYFEEDAEPIAAIGEARPDILLVGMGVPRQERWMETAKGCLDVPLMIGVGGALDVWSGERRRAPRAWQRLGLEWLYRLLSQPRRFKDVSRIPRFVGRVLAARAAIDLERFLRLRNERG